MEEPWSIKDGGDPNNQESSSDGRTERTATNAQKGPKVHTSFRIKTVVEMFSKMKGEKEIWLKEVGLHGLTHLPREDPASNRSFNWQFAFWLLNSLDSESATLDLGVRGRIELRCEDVELVFGIPCSGTEIHKSDPLKINTTKQLVKKGLMLGTGCDLSLENVAMVLEREIPGESNGDHKKAFIMASFIFAVSYVLAPKGRPPKVNCEILECILDTGNILNINWASYMLHSLRDASAKLKRELVAGTKSVTLDGCLLFLQIVYLDNLDFGVLTTKQDIIPRVIDFPFEKLEELINADKKKIGGSRATKFGVAKLRRDQDTLYTRGDLYRSISLSKQRMQSGVFSESDKIKVLEYVKKHIDEGKRIVKDASRQLEEIANNTLDRCHQNISALLDMWLAGRIEAEGFEEKTWRDRETNVSIIGDGDGGKRGRYKTSTKRPGKVRKIDTTNIAADGGA